MRSSKRAQKLNFSVIVSALFPLSIEVIIMSLWIFKTWIPDTTWFKTSGFGPSKAKIPISLQQNCQKNGTTYNAKIDAKIFWPFSISFSAICNSFRILCTEIQFPVSTDFPIFFSSRNTFVWAWREQMWDVF